MQNCAKCKKGCKGTTAGEAKRVEKYGSQEEVNKKWLCRTCKKETKSVVAEPSATEDNA